MLRDRPIPRFLFPLAAAAVVALGGSTLAGAQSRAVVKVSVTLTNSSVKLSKTKLSAGQTSFAVLNSGTKSRLFSIAGKKTKMLAHGKKATLVVTLKSGKVSYYASPPKKTGFVTVTAASSGGGGSTAAVADGKKVFSSAGCASCHTLKAANATGTVGPDLDQVKPSQSTVESIVTNGYNGPGAPTPMPAFAGQLSTTQIKDVAAFVYASTH